MTDGQYENRVVAFLDILGFSALASQADDDELRDRIIAGLAVMRATLPAKTEKGDSDFRTTQFSDCIVVSARTAQPLAVDLVLIAVSVLTTSLLQHGLLLRGGVAVGNMIHTGDLLFGPALLAAHGLDQSGAPPRIGLTEQVVKLVGARLSTLKSLVKKDSYDLEPMLNYLFQYEEFDGKPGIAGAIVASDGMRLAKVIARECYAANLPPTARSKWLWLERYWNDSVAMKKVFPTTERFKKNLSEA